MTRKFKEGLTSTTIRLPQDILDKVEKIQDRERSDRTNVITKAVEYWVSVDGKATSDGEYLKRLEQIDTNIISVVSLLKQYDNELSECKKTIEELKTLVSKQNNTIDLLVEKVLARK